jgi:hypothetical protein
MTDAETAFSGGRNNVRNLHDAMISLECAASEASKEACRPDAIAFAVNPVTHLSSGQIVVSPAGSILIQNLPGFVPGALTSPPVTSLPTVNLSVLGAGR